MTKHEEILRTNQMNRTLNDWNVADEFKNMTLDEIKAVQKKERLPYSIALLNMNGGLNVGMAIRSAVIFGAEKVFLIGKKKYDKRSTVGAHNYIDIEYIEEDPIETPFLALNDICMEYDPYLVEQGGKDLYCEDFKFKNPCFIFGCESTGIPKEILDVGKEFNFETVSIAQIGVLRSLNVASAAAIVMWKAAMDLRTVPGSTL